MHSILGLAMLVGTIAAFFKWQQDGFEKKSPLSYFFYFFLVFSIFHFLLSLPLIFSADLKIAGWGYDVAIASVFLLFFVGSKMAAYFYGLSMEKSGYTSFIILISGFATLIAQIAHSSLPVIGHDGFIYWNGNPIASMIITISAYVYSFSLAYIMVGNFLKVSKTKARLKLFLISAGWISIGISSVYFIANTQALIISAFVFNFLGGISIACAFLVDDGGKRENKVVKSNI